MRKTLTVGMPAETTEAPALKRKGRGWNIAESRLDTLHEAAREMRRNPTPAQEALAAALTAANLGKYRLRRQVVIGSAIVDFACQPLGVAVEIEDEGVDATLDRRRDKSLELVGVKVLRFTAAEVLEDAEGVTARIVAELKGRWHEARTKARPAGGERRQTGGYRR
jgi:very-short-patch-repair endonuclease